MTTVGPGLTHSFRARSEENRLNGEKEESGALGEKEELKVLQGGGGTELAWPQSLLLARSSKAKIGNSEKETRKRAVRSRSVTAEFFRYCTHVGWFLCSCVVFR